MSDGTDDFVIDINDGGVLEATGAPQDKLVEANSLMKRILAKAEELLQGNLPPWPVVEEAVITAYNTFVRPLSILNFLNNALCNTLIREVKKTYDSLAEDNANR